LKFPEVRLAKPLGELLNACETRCVAECCGWEAFDFTPRRIESWFAARPGQREAVREQIRAVLADLGKRAEGTLSFPDVNACWPKGEAVEFFSGLGRLMDGGS
jgi:hypothetical protein